MEAKDSSKKATAKNTTAKNTTSKKTTPKKTNPKKTKIEYIDELDISQELLNESKALTLYDPKVLVNTSKVKPENLAIETIVRKDKLSIEVGSKPSSADLQEIEKDDKHYFNFNNKSKSTYIECYKTEDYFIEFYKKFGKPDLFITFTCNPKWPEIVAALPAHAHWQHHGDITERVFMLKLKSLLNDIV